MTISLTPEQLALVPTIIIVLQMVKKIEVLQKVKQWFPLIAVGIAIAAGYLTGSADPILDGVLIGCAAAGGYDTTKPILK